MTFDSCFWTGNSARFGAAVDISPQIHYLHINDLKTEITFVDCIFRSNYLINDTVDTSKQYTSYERGKGSGLPQGNLIFANNTDSAMYLTSTEVEFA